MKRAACTGKGVYQAIPDGGDLKKAMANYFSYLAVGIIPRDGTDQQIRWAETYEDGQGIGQNTAACAPVYDKSVSPPDLFAVVCSAVKDGDLANMAGWQAEWQAIKQSAASCPTFDLNEAQLETIRNTISSDSSCVNIDDPGADDGGGGGGNGGMVGGIIGGATGGIVCLVAIAYFCCRKKPGDKARGGGGGGGRRDVEMRAADPPVAVAQPVHVNPANGGGGDIAPVAVPVAYHA